MAQLRFAGYRNVSLILAYLVWTLGVLHLTKPPTGFSPELLYAVSTVLSWVGGIVVAALTARAANKIADRWEPAGRRSPSGADSPNGGPPPSSVPAHPAGT